MKKKNQRKLVLVDRSFQLRLIITAYLPVLVVILLGMAFGYWQISLLSSKLQFKSFNEMILKLGPSLYPYTKTSKDLFGLFHTMIIFGGIGLIVVSLAFVSILFLYFSHKIAGPVYRFSQAFQDIAEGNFSKTITLRNNDQLQGLARDYNQMIHNMHDKISQIQQSADHLQRHMGELDHNQENMGKIGHIKDICRELGDRVHLLEDGE